MTIIYLISYILLTVLAGTNFYMFLQGGYYHNLAAAILCLGVQFLSLVVLL